MTRDDGRPDPGRPRAGSAAVLIASALAVALACAGALLATGVAAGVRARLDPAPTPTGTQPAWLAAPSSAPTLAGAALLDSDAPGPDPAALAKLLDPRLDLRSGTVGAVVLDASGRPLYSRAATEGRAPASNLKLVTAAAALTSLRPDARLSTRVVRGAQPGSVVLVGGGDVLLGEGASRPEDVLGRAGLATLAEQAAQALTGAGGTGTGSTGSTGSTDDGGLPPSAGAGAGGAGTGGTGSPPASGAFATVTVQFDDSLFTGPALSPAWAPEDVEAGEIGPVQALALYGGRRAPGLAGPRPSDPAKEAAAAFRNALETALAGSGMRVAPGVERVPEGQGAGRAALSESVRQPEGDRAGTGTAAAGTTAPGSTAPGSTAPGATSAPSAAAPQPPAAPLPGQIAAVESASIAEQVRFMLRESDNYAAEALARLASAAAGGPASGAGATLAARAAAERILGSAEGLVIDDASGLAASDRLTPEALAGLVRAMAVGSDARLREALGGLPVAHLTGTLAERFGDGPAEAGAGVVRAKTGTLLAVAALTGYTVDAEGRLLVFSFVANGLTPQTRPAALAAIDGAVAALAQCGCGAG
ncbi:D-alanyl-D-alanine carboxypeptidase [Sinomonas halotolerans]|uniref:D-alanyl-D-alanine carboxypeptidase n=1 Tax=Sinomonas halotolerans TaxID=1644133 RepID=A0ABU9WX58_9MICC